MIDLRLGRYQDVLRDVMCDALIVDAPYSARTHSGHDAGTDSVNRERFSDDDEKRMRVDKRTGATYAVGVNRRRTLSYGAWGDAEIAECVDFWHERTRGWFVTITDTELAPIWSAHLERVGRCVFSPLAFVAPGSRVRITGDGPAQWSCWIVVARPRVYPYTKWGALPGAYVLPKGQNNRKGDELDVIGGKPTWLMQSLVRDYSRPGELVCDPCAGGGTTLLSAEIEQRRAVGSEALVSHYERAHKRFARGFTPSLFG